MTKAAGKPNILLICADQWRQLQRSKRWSELQRIVHCGQCSKRRRGTVHVICNSRLFYSFFGLGRRDERADLQDSGIPCYEIVVLRCGFGVT